MADNTRIAVEALLSSLGTGGVIAAILTFISNRQKAAIERQVAEGTREGEDFSLVTDRLLEFVKVLEADIKRTRTEAAEQLAEVETRFNKRYQDLQIEYDRLWEENERLKQENRQTKEQNRELQDKVRQLIVRLRKNDIDLGIELP